MMARVHRQWINARGLIVAPLLLCFEERHHDQGSWETRSNVFLNVI